jgi:sRNA-binding regulator protein Hfq
VSTTKVINNAKVNIITSNGITIKTFEFNGTELECDIRALPLGMYTIKLQTENIQQLHKITKME